MGKLLDMWNKGRFSVYSSEEKTVLKLIENINNFLGKEVITELENKVSQGDNFTGSWHGISKPTQSQEGLSGTVDQHQVIIGSNEINFLGYIYQHNIDVSDNYDVALESAIIYCIENNKSLFIPNGEYKLTKAITIERQGSINLYIRGESKMGTNLNFALGGLNFTSPIKQIDYSTRISQIHISDLALRGSTKTGNGLSFEYFGYIQTRNVLIRGFNKGLSLVDGSEYDDYNSQIYSNTIGIYFNKTTPDGRSDLANINFLGTRVYSNDNTVISESVREVKFDGCALMSYIGGLKFNGISNVVNFVSCDFENIAGTNDLILDDNGTFNIMNCVFANPHPNKIILNGNVKVNISGTVLDNTIKDVININNGFTGSINFDRPYNNYLIKGDSVFDNFSHDPLINTINWDFSKQHIAPYGVNATFTPNTSSYVTGNCSLQFQATTAEKYISIPIGSYCDQPTAVDIIVSGNDSNNLVRLVFEDGTVSWNFSVGGADLPIQNFSNGFKRVFSLLPTSGKKIASIQIVLRGNTITPCIDSVRIYGKGSSGFYLRSGSIPTSGVWKLGDKVINSSPSPGSYEGWICVSGTGTTLGTWKGYGLIQA